MANLNRSFNLQKKLNGVPAKRVIIPSKEHYSHQL